MYQKALDVKVALDERLAMFVPPRVGDDITANQAKNVAVLAGYRGMGRVAPNPMVGAVVVSRANRLLGIGAHLRLGEAHAEVNATTGLSPEDLKGATIYVTLEPCAYEGRTPACASFLTTSGIARVIYGVQDPNPKVSGEGIRILRSAGLEVMHDASWQIDCEKLAEIFLHNQRQRRPLVAMKAAVSSNGMIGRRGDSRVWITGERARQYGRFLRGYYDAIMIGGTTLERDDPQLDARDTLVPCRDPIRLVLDPSGSRASRSWRLTVLNPERTIWIVGEGVEKAVTSPLVAKGCQIWRLPTAKGRFLAHDLVRAAQDAEITSLLLEGGSHVYGTFLAQSLVDRVHLFKAREALLGDDALPLVAPEFGTSSLELKNQQAVPLGPDTLIEGTL